MGKTLADLQSNISISAENAATGDIEFCSGYTGFSDDASEQSGWYLALKVSPSVGGTALEGATITATYGGTVRTLADGETFIIRLAEGEDSITFAANKEGYIEGRLTLDLSGLTLKPIPQTLTISIPENTDEIGHIAAKSTISIQSQDLFRQIPGQVGGIGTLTDIDSKTKQLSSDKSLYRMSPMIPLNSTISMSGAIIPIKITRLNSTYTVKFRKGTSTTENPIGFDSNDIGYLLTGINWRNDWPYHINVYNSSNELIDTYTIEKTGNFNESTTFQYTKISNLASTNTLNLYYRTDALPNGTDIVPGIEDASGNPVPVSTFQENLVIPSSGFAGEFASGTIHYVQGLKYSDTQTALDDGYYIILKVPQYTGSDAQYLYRIRYGISTKWELGCDIQNPSTSNTPAITKPLPIGEKTITRRIENYIYQNCVPADTSGQIYPKNQQPNLTFDPVPTPGPNPLTDPYIELSGITYNGQTYSMSDFISGGTLTRNNRDITLTGATIKKCIIDAQETDYNNHYIAITTIPNMECEYQDTPYTINEIWTTSPFIINTVSTPHTPPQTMLLRCTENAKVQPYTLSLKISLGGLTGKLSLVNCTWE